MPKNPPSGWNAYPKLGDAARAEMLIACRCRKCRRTVHDLAADLMEHFAEISKLAGRPHDLVMYRIIGELWGKCPRCGASGEDWSEQERFATHEDVGHTLIRRPDGFRKIRLWRNEWYGPTVKVP